MRVGALGVGEPYLSHCFINLLPKRKPPPPNLRHPKSEAAPTVPFSLSSLQGSPGRLGNPCLEHLFSCSRQDLTLQPRLASNAGHRSCFSHPNTGIINMHN